MSKDSGTRQPPVRIPIPFEQFVEGVLKIDPKKLAASWKKAREEAGREEEPEQSD